MEMNNMSVASILKEFTPENNGTAPEGTPAAQPLETTRTEGSVASMTSTEDTSDFFSLLDERIFKENILIPFNNEDGTDYIRPKSIDELVEVLEANKTALIEQAKYEDQEAVLADIFAKTTPAFQFLAQNANQFSSIEDMLPLIQSVQTQDELANLDIENIDHQEFIVSSVLAMQGLDKATIEDEIKDLKERNKLGTRAEILKPTLDKIQADNTEKILQERAVKAEQDKQFWNNYYQNLNQMVIQAPEIYGLKITKEDKIKLANNLIPAKDGSGLPLYNKIDQAIGSGNMDVLAVISLLLENPESVASYFSEKMHTASGQAAVRTLRQGVTSKPTEEINDPSRQNPKRTNAPLYGNFMNSK